eukprot:CAMPEP_0116845640 /NCGR_PEP_ID=MMETSP0418-20121206/13384_1 /TAXON_ID=1158023 /ORGANISM="Astrosyne radiata, Strain 13vi08-1A" /LENGTH=194 /DNA_ID=CAMNT_0004476783 /DNA_START=83 /DNA_END=667 /DNA_ORIENTATION=+
MTHTCFQSLLVALCLLVLAQSFAPPMVARTPRSATSLAAVSRKEFLSAAVAAMGAVALQPAFADDVVTLENGIKYTVLKAGTGPKPVIGDLVGIRFRAFYKDTKIDDIFDTAEPYYTRVGAGGLIKGVEETLPLMRLGDDWSLAIPGELAFGEKGRPASPGKPRIPANADITFEVKLETLPGKEEELIEIIGDV